MHTSKWISAALLSIDIPNCKPGIMTAYPWDTKVLFFIAGKAMGRISSILFEHIRFTVFNCRVHIKMMIFTWKVKWIDKQHLCYIVTHPPTYLYTLLKHTHTHIYVPLENLRTGRKKQERRGYWWSQVPRKTNVDLMETSRGCCLSSRREAKVLRKDLIHKCLEDRKDLRLWELTPVCQAAWSMACLKELLKYFDPCWQL